MKNNNNVNDNFDFLRNFAADPASGITQTQTIRAEARLEQILAEPPNLDLSNQKVSTKWGHRKNHGLAWNPLASTKLNRRIRWAAIPVAAAAIIATGIIWPHNPVNPAPALTAHAALATWQPVPSSISEDLTELADAQCRNDLELAATSLVEGFAAHAQQGFTWPGQTMSDPTIGDRIIAERRGDWGFLAYAAEVAVDGEQVTNTASCLVWFPAHHPGEAVVMTAYFNTGGGSTLGSTSPTWDPHGDRPFITRPQALQHWATGGSTNLVDDAGNTLPILQGLGARFEDETAFQAVIGNLGDATSVTIQLDDGEVIPSVSGNWFAAWWPVTRDMDRLANIFQCQDDWAELDRLDPAAANLVTWCPFFGSEFTPQITAITLTQADGAALTYSASPTADHDAAMAMAAAVEAARTARQFAEAQAAQRGEELPPIRSDRPNHDHTMQNNPAETGIDLPWLSLANEQITLPTHTDIGLPVIWEIDPNNNPNGATIVGDVLNVGEVSLSGNAPEALRIVAAIQVGERAVRVGFTMNVVPEDFLLQFAGNRGMAWIRTGEVDRLQRALNAVPVGE